jgi:outer membrane protein
MGLNAMGKLKPLSILILGASIHGANGLAQCAALVTSPSEVLSCVQRAVPHTPISTLDPKHQYSLAELIDIGEVNNPRTRVSWELAKQKAGQLGIDKSEYFPLLTGLVTGGDQRSINPFPESLVARGYTLVELPFVQPEITLSYVLFDFGARGARVESAKFQALAASAGFIQVNQDTAFAISTDYFALVTAQERLQAATDILKTAQTTQDASEQRLSNGRATLPDVLNARAETAQASFDLEAADGEEKIDRVILSQAIGFNPSPDISIDAKRTAPLPSALILSVDQLIERAMADRPDLITQLQEIRAADAEVRVADAAYKPKVVLSAAGAQTAGWPTTNVFHGALGHANEPTWSVTMGLQWTIFDGGRRRNQKLVAESSKREAVDELKEKHDQAQREVWSSYIAFNTAVRQEQAAVALLSAADMSYSASLDAYKSGVKNLVDVVTSERELSLARLSSVAARSRLFLAAVRLESVTGNLLRALPPATTIQDNGAQQ